VKGSSRRFRSGRSFAFVELVPLRGFLAKWPYPNRSAYLLENAGTPYTYPAYVLAPEARRGAAFLSTGGKPCGKGRGRRKGGIWASFAHDPINDKEAYHEQREQGSGDE